MMAEKQQGKGQAGPGIRPQLKRPRETPKVIENDVTAENPSMTLDDETTCAICLESFQNPMIIHCGHSFCQNCITGYWKGSDFNVWCPSCKACSFRKILIPNKNLETIVKNYKELGLQSRSPQIKRRCTQHKKGLKLSSENDLNLISTARERSNAHQGHIFDFPEDTVNHHMNETPAKRRETLPELKQLLDLLKEDVGPLSDRLETIGRLFDEKNQDSDNSQDSEDLEDMEIKIPDIAGTFSVIQEKGKHVGPQSDRLETNGRQFDDNTVDSEDLEDMEDKMPDIIGMFRHIQEKGKHVGCQSYRLETNGRQFDEDSKDLEDMEDKVPDIIGMFSDIQEKGKHVGPQSDRLETNGRQFDDNSEDNEDLEDMEDKMPTIMISILQEKGKHVGSQSDRLETNGRQFDENSEDNEDLEDMEDKTPNIIISVVQEKGKPAFAFLEM